ncbi:MAG TPA: hypothetical protein VEP48_00220 [Methylomirabilota bacterium]|nr:hypothetical protein [Methylomirabilota bacterium]
MDQPPKSVLRAIVHKSAAAVREGELQSVRLVDGSRQNPVELVRMARVGETWRGQRERAASPSLVTSRCQCLVISLDLADPGGGAR